MAETFGVTGRGPLYEETGAVRDVIQNHILEVITCLAMEAPRSGEASAVRDARTRMLQAIEPIDPVHVVRGQFRGYRDEKGVAADSSVETFAALRLTIDSWRWAGVPFFVRAGKRLPVTCTEVLVRFRPPPTAVFDASALDTAWSNQVRFRLGPDVTTALRVRSKRPGETMSGESVELSAVKQVAVEMLPYERLLGDAMDGDATLFTSEEAVEAAWRVVDPILEKNAPVLPYDPGTWGPVEASALTAHHGGWHDPAGVLFDREPRTRVTPTPP